MSIRRTLTKGVALSTLLLLVAGPAGAATQTTTRGTAATTSVPLHVEALNLPIDLGETVLMATTDSDTTTLAPWSTVQLTLANIGGARFGEVAVSSDGTTTNPGTDVTRNTAVGEVGATVGNVLTLADDSAHTATAALTTLTTEATVLNALGLEASISDVVTTVNNSGAAATHSLAVADIDLDLAHVLGSVLAELPLADLLALADLFPSVDVPVNLDSVGDVVTATEELITAVTVAVNAANDVETAVNGLLAADDGKLADLQALQGDIAALITAGTLDLAAVTALTTILTDPLLSSCGIAPTLPTLTQNLSDAADCVAGLIADHLGSLTGALGTLDEAVTAYVDAVAAAALAATEADAAAGDMPVSAIVDDIADLVAGLLDADLLAVGPINVSQQVRAVGGQLDASSASHTCDVTTIAALGATPVEIADCDGANAALTTVVDTINGTLQTVLDIVGGIDAGGGASLELFGTVEDTVAEGEDGWVRATSVMEVLALTVPDITVTPCEIADGLVCGLGLDIDGTLTTVLDTLATLLEGAETVAEGAIDTVPVNDLLTALGAADLIGDVTDVDVAGALLDVQGAVDAITDALNTLIDGLGDLGDAGGVTVPGAEIVVDPALEAEHQVVVAAGGPTDPAPDPDDDPTLPNTGGGAALLAILAMGAGAWLWRRREAQ